MISRLFELDQKLLLFINKQHTPWTDKLMWFVSERLSKHSIQIIVFAALSLVFRKRSPRLLIFLIVMLMLVSELVVIVTKKIVKRKRPFVGSERVRIIKNYRLSDASFYSAHAANAFVPVVFVATLVKNKIIKAVLYTLGCLVGYSRMYLGQHYPTDVLTGFAAGAIFGKIGAWIYKTFTGRN